MFKTLSIYVKKAKVEYIDFRVTEKNLNVKKYFRIF